MNLARFNFENNLARVHVIIAIVTVKLGRINVDTFLILVRVVIVAFCCDGNFVRP